MAKRKTKVRSVEGMRRVGNTTADVSDYAKVKSASGRASLDCADDIARKLRGKTLDQVFKLVAKACGEPEKALRTRYGKLNAGLARMSLGNKLRGAGQEA